MRVWKSNIWRELRRKGIEKDRFNLERVLVENKEGVWITGESGCVIERTSAVEESKEGADNERRESQGSDRETEGRENEIYCAAPFQSVVKSKAILWQ